VALALAAAAVGQAFIVPGALVHKGARRASVLMKANTPLASEEEVKAEAGLKVGGTCGLGRPGLRTSAAAGCRAPAAHPQPTHESTHMRVTPCAAVMTNTHTTYTCSVAECTICARTTKGSSCGLCRVTTCSPHMLQSLLHRHTSPINTSPTHSLQPNA
jgi:hypothetical protein